MLFENVYPLNANINQLNITLKLTIMRKLSIITVIGILTFSLAGCLGPAEISNSTMEVNNKKVPTIIVGNQEWMASNLNVGKFANGEPILHAKTVNEWVKAGQDGVPAWCYYNNDPDLGAQYGKLYNWYAVSDSRGLAPDGWRIPDDTDWNNLVDKFGNKNNAGARLKSTSGWLDDGNGEIADGFNAYPAGGRYNNGTFSSKGASAFFWSASDHLMFYGRYRVLHHNKSSIESNSLDKSYGFSIRCVRTIED